MKKLVFLVLSVLTLGFYGCVEEPVIDPNDKVQPTISLEKESEGHTTVTFKVTTTDAVEAFYSVVADSVDVPSLNTILSDGTIIELDEKGAAKVTVENLQPQTSYKVVAAATNYDKVAGSNTLYFTTKALDEITLTVDIVQVDHEKMNFRVHSTNAEKISYLVLFASKEVPSAEYVLLNGESIEVGSKEAVAVTGLENDKEYQLIVAAEGSGQKFLAEPTLFETKESPDKIIEHNYTRARGTKYGSSYFMMFSYEDENEADNFAYNDATLSLDFYGDPEKDYLPAGTYEVKESTEPDCISSYRYSTYGYTDGVQLESGQAVVSIDPETKAYTFDIDLYLKDGRHLKATYTGDVDNMTVIDIITLSTDFNSASATTADDGENWILTLTDAMGNVAKFDVCNSFKAPYLANSVYTINTSSEETAIGTVEAGQFNAETSLFTVAGEGDKKFLTGSLHVDIDWAAQKYILTFYGTLEDNYVVEAKYDGAIDGISLIQRDEIIDVLLTSAVASSYENNTNWYITFTQTVDNGEKYRLVLDCICPASEFLTAGSYSLGNSVDGRYLGTDATKLSVEGEGEYQPVEANALVNIDMTSKTYSFDISFKVEDGRTFKFAYTGLVDGMEVIDIEEPTDDIVWTTVKAKHWYSDNWVLTISDAEAKYVIEFDLRTGDDASNYLIPGAYTIGEDGQYIDAYYSTFNGNKNAFKEATLNVNYNEADQTYDMDFDVTLTDDSNFKGQYSGAVEGSPEEE